MVTLLNFLRDEQGASAAEFALVLTPLLIFIFGIIDAGRYVWTVNQSEKATQVGARMLAVTNPLAKELTSTSYVGKTVGGVVLTQGDRIPAAALGVIRCTSTACTCKTAPCPADPLTFEDTELFSKVLMPRMQSIRPEITASNVVVEYRGSGLGFAGDPNGTDIEPLVTVKLVADSSKQDNGMAFPLLTTMAFASLKLPQVSTTLPAEDLSGTTSF
ncbi:pilus assembly protein [Sphingomonas sp. BN140010]|uniref:Pilus assembly protein n=1 Tax=Sphingomonas arvum TaxID=2992113 RepID=A0ABT3JE40_9SPHN|nr:TadE family protein [Sphingomonas sp. BN140010]MCW3797179.1 pilus assembly protein [Sphingomonas sp. BN140010]